MFLVCSYPVILSIENHCSIKQQKAMALYMLSIFGDKLCHDHISEKSTHLPTPETLKRKILVKVSHTIKVELNGVNPIL